MKNLTYILKKLCLYALLLVFITPLMAQEDKCSKPNKKAENMYEDANKEGIASQSGYEKLVLSTKLDPTFTKAYWQLAKINEGRFYSDPRRYPNGLEQANKFFLKVIETCQEYKNYEAIFLVGKFFYEERQFADAGRYLVKYIRSVDVTEKNHHMEEALEMNNNVDKYFKLIEHEVPFTPVKVPNVSTYNEEYLPALSPDNTLLFFTRKQKTRTYGATLNEEKELFIQSRIGMDGKFTEGVPMPEKFNMGLYQGGATISVDNKLIFITVINQVNVSGVGFSNADIYFSEFSDGSWSELKSLGRHINKVDVWEGQPTISSDNKTLYFVRAIREGDGKTHFGGMDIYKTVRMPDGNWTVPVNLGPAINTPGDEKSPFMHSDSQTLYFSSNYHVGIGGFDIFYSKISDRGEPGIPINIGYPINDEDDQHGFVVSTDGKYGYFSSNEQGNLDLFSFELYEEARPEKVMFVRGKIERMDGIEDYTDVKVELKNVVTEKVIEGVVDKDGDYVAVIAVKENEDVVLTAKKKDFAFASAYVEQNENTVGKPIKRTMEIAPIAVGKKYKINDIYFTSNSFDLTTPTISILNQFVDFLDENPSVKVAIEGHTDSDGDDGANMELSKNRAHAVYQYLILEGVDKARLSFKGYGETKPLASNDTPEGRAKNRRTEFLITDK